MKKFVTESVLHESQNSACKIKLCTDTYYDRKVVVKVYNLDILRRIKNYRNLKERMITADPLAPLKSELEVLRQVHHPACVRLLAFSEDTERLKLVFPVYGSGHIMEPVSSLSYVPRIPHLSRPCTIRSLIEAIHSALEYIHSLNIIHGDISPSNILHDVDGGFVLSDFGSARFTTSDGAANESPAALAFFPPEVCIDSNKGSHNGFKADIFAFGMSVWCCMFLELPYVIAEEGNMLELIERIAKWDVWEADLSRVPTDLAHWFQSVLAKDPDIRRIPCLIQAS